MGGFGPTINTLSRPMGQQCRERRGSANRREVNTDKQKTRSANMRSAAAGHCRSLATSTLAPGLALCSVVGADFFGSNRVGQEQRRVYSSFRHLLLFPG